MIQRIQTLYLLLVAILMAAVNFFPLVWFKVADGQYYTMTSLGIEASGIEEFSGVQYWCYCLPLLSCLVAILSLMALFGYKNRVRQMRLCVYAILGVIAYYAVFGAEVWSVMSALGDTTTFPNPGVMAQLPLISVILLILAGRAIKRDEDLVRSMDRIR